MENYERLRSAGYLEKYSIARHPLGFYYNVGVTATYTLPETYTRPLRDYVYKACEILIGQHPVLSAVPVDEESDEAYFVRLPEINLAQPVSFHKRSRGFPEGDATDTELDEYLQTQHSTGFTTPGAPYWRLAIFTAADEDNDDASARRRFTAAYIFHHALGDGTSGKIFQETFLEALTAAGSALSSAAPGEGAKQIVATPAGTPLPPNLEAAHPCGISLPFLLGAVVKMKFGGRDRGLWTGAPVFTPLEARARHLVIPAAVSAAFRQSCRRNGATVTAAVQAAMAQALFAHLPPQCTKLRLTGAISVRKWLTQPIPEKSLGVWVMDFGESYWRKSLPVADAGTFPWKEAQRTRETIERVVAMKGKNTGVNLLKYVSSFSEFFQSKLGKPRGESIELSNIGVLGASDEAQSDPSKPQMGRVIFSQSPNAAGAAIVVSAISGGDGCLVLSFGWQKGVVEPELVSGMIDSVEKLVHLAAQ